MPSDLHLFGLAGYGPHMVAPYCTCGLIFSAIDLMTPAPRIRREWVNHVKRVEDGTETVNPLA